MESPRKNRSYAPIFAILAMSYLGTPVLNGAVLPDLVIHEFNPVAGSYDPNPGAFAPIPVTLVVTNALLNDPFNLPDFTDIEFRLSLDTVWGDDDDIILASLNVPTSMGSSMILSASLELPVGIAEGSYYLGAYADVFNKIEEEEAPDFVQYSATDNNLRFTPNALITVNVHPDLVVDEASFDNLDIYHPEDRFFLSYTLRNTGLEDMPADTTIRQRVSLYAVSGPSYNIDYDTVFEIITNPLNPGEVPEDYTWVSTLAEFSDTLSLEGISQANIEGGFQAYDLSLSLPAFDAFLSALGLVDISGFSFYIVIEVDIDDELVESAEGNTFAVLAALIITTLPASGDTYDQWTVRFEALHSYNFILGDSEDDYDGDGLINLFEYAINSNPLVATYQLEEFAPSQPQVTRIDNEDYLALAVDLNRYATDIVYKIEVSTGLGPFVPILTLEPPYLDAHGPQSLLGIGGLIDNDFIESITVNGYTARILVRDTVPVDNLETRFMRLVVEPD